MTDAFNFTKLVPGFDFLQGLAKTASAAIPGMAGIPGMGQWVAPTLNPEEIEKRISELRTVQFWLEQNARMLSATIQALEVQRMTLSTLKTMNVQMGDLRDSLTAAVPVFKGAVKAQEDVDEVATFAAADIRPPPADIKPPPGVDPMQWWGALTQQFTELASKAVKDNATDAAKSLVSGAAGAMLKGGMQVAEQSMKVAAGMPARAVRKATQRVADLNKDGKLPTRKTAPQKTSPRKR